ncbi:SPOR domain-containing protein [bacterium]|nr:SPOR domain-containing protein [bacterium]
MRIVFPLLLAFLVLIAIGCVRPVKGLHEEPATPAGADTTQTSAEPFDPVTLGGDVFEEELLEKESPETENIFGYRVQLGAFGDEANARTLQVLAEAEFDKPVYVILEEPFWCVRLGDFREMSEAEAMKKAAISKGFTDARIIEDKIKAAD